MSTTHFRRESGFALITVLSLLGLLALLLAASFLASTVEVSTTESSVNASTGFFSAEAGLNLRGDEIAQTFEGFNVPTGTGPTTADPCSGGDLGSGDFACRTDALNGRDVVTYVLEDGASELITIPRSDPNGYGGLNAFEDRYRVVSEANNTRTDRPEAILEMVFRSRLVPLFQYAAFYDKDLEILPGPDMVLNGRVHANGDLYLNANNNLRINGVVTVGERDGGTGGGLFRGRKDTNGNCGGVVRVDDADAATGPDQPAIACAGWQDQPALDAWNGQIRTGLERIEVPADATFDLGGEYWQKADLRLVLDVDATPPRIFAAQSGMAVPNEPEVDGIANAALDLCAGPGAYRPYLPQPETRGPLEWSTTFTNQREGGAITMLEIDTQGLIDCMRQQRDGILGLGNDIDDADEGGLVVYATVVGPNSQTVNRYGVRVRNGAQLASTDPGAPQIRGLTMVTDQAMYVQGDYNVDVGSQWRPASFLADSLNVLSNAWNGDWTDPAGNTVYADRATDFAAPGDNGARAATATQINAAFMAGTDTTGNQEGTGGAGGGRNSYNGGLENYPRFHENWGGVQLRYRGSFVSLGNADRVAGTWANQSYQPPQRNWDYDQRFNDPTQLPPLSPRFVYLVQELFVRDFEQ